MNLGQAITLASLVALGLSGCSHNDYYDQGGGYGTDPYSEASPYGTPSGYGDGGGYGNPYATDQASESGDVVSIPGDGGGYNTPYGSPTPPPSYGGGGTASARTYTVKKGDNLYRIGKTHGVTMQEIIQQNGLQSTTIHPGQQLIIP